MLRIRSLLADADFALAGVFVFVLISYSGYSFESRESFHELLISIFFAISLVVGVVYGQMYANSLLSRITNTKPGELGLDFWVRLGTFAFVPLLSLLSVQFPSINHLLFSWLQPALQSIKWKKHIKAQIIAAGCAPGTI